MSTISGTDKDHIFCEIRPIWLLMWQTEMEQTLNFFSPPTNESSNWMTFKRIRYRKAKTTHIVLAKYMQFFPAAYFSFLNVQG